MSAVVEEHSLVIGIFGSPDFCRRCHSIVRGYKPEFPVTTAPLVDALGSTLTHRPNLIFVEIGFHHSDRLQVVLRSFLEQVRDRSGKEVHIAVALTAPEALTYGGDLLYLTPGDLAPSEYVDTFLALPPSNLPTLRNFSRECF